MEKSPPIINRYFTEAAAQMVNKYGKMLPEKGKLKQANILHPVLAK